jgi:hypothetical protein
MSDPFLSDLREEPRPEFAEQLAARLRQIEHAEPEGQPARPAWRLRLLLAASVAAAGTLALTLPPVRAAARDFLDLFRVQRFAAVPVDPERIAHLQQRGLDLKALVGPQVEMLEPGVEPEPVADAATAAAQAGIELRMPARAPDRTTPGEIHVGHPGAFRVRLDVAKLRSLADLLGVDSADVPDAWDGASVEVHGFPVVGMSFHREDGDFVFLQSRSPEVSLPPGVELARLGELGLRLAGMSAAEARLFARTIDWRTTLLVPVPAQGSHFREVEVRGRKGLMVSSRQTARNADGGARPGRWESVLLWTDGDRVYAAAGPGQGMEVLQLAQSAE